MNDNNHKVLQPFDKTDVNGLKAIAGNIAAQYNMKGCVVLVSDGVGGVRMGCDGLDNDEIVETSNILTYYALKAKFECMND